MGDFAVKLEPRVVEWAVESSGMDRGAIADALSVTPPQVGEWIRTGKMKYSKMRALAECVRRPEAALLLKRPPDEKILIDYRMIKGASGMLGPDDTLSVRKARYAQSAAREMMDVRGDPPEPGIGAGAAVSDSHEATAMNERKRLGMDAGPDGALVGSCDKLYGCLRESVESLNIFVFQYPLDGGTVRGLSMTGDTPYTILVNSRDPPWTKTVTLLHEYGHVLLRKGGVCRDAVSVSAPHAGGARIESWCNGFATAFLMPAGAFYEEARRLEGQLRDADLVVDRLAKKFKASKHAAAMRAAGMPGGKFSAGYAALAAQSANKCGPRPSDGGPDRIAALLSRHGKKFTKLVLSSHREGAITTHDVSEYLDMDLDHLEAVRARVNSTG